MTSAAVSSLISERGVSAAFAFLVVYGLLMLVERGWHAATRKGIDLGKPARDRFVLSRTQELVGVLGAVALSSAAIGLAVAAG